MTLPPPREPGIRSQSPKCATTERWMKSPLEAGNRDISVKTVGKRGELDGTEG
jgi:hypothetical protein